MQKRKRCPLRAKALECTKVVIAFGILCESKGVASGICPRCPEACFYWSILLDYANRDVPELQQLDTWWNATKKKHDEDPMADLSEVAVGLVVASNAVEFMQGARTHLSTVSLYSRTWIRGYSV